jgi:predicted nucleic acid-binding protein
MAKNQMILCDTNIFIKLFHGHAKVKENLDKIGSVNTAFSIITFAEIVYGTKKSNIAAIQSYFSGLNEIHINTEISKMFKGITLSYSYNHHIKIPDALIAATAVCTGMQLYTLNKKDFDFIPEIKFYRP